MEEKKIGFFVSDSVYVRNFIDTGILNSLCEKFNIYVFYRENLNIDKKKISFAKAIESYKISNQDHAHQYANLVSLWNKKDKAISFKHRVLEYFNLDIENFKKQKELEKNILKKFKNLISFLKRKLEFYFLAFFSNKMVFPLYKTIVIDNIKINTSLVEKIEKNNINLVVQPSSGHLPETLDLLRYCKNKKISSYLIVDNWDNLSSKVSYYHKPDYISVWGLQSKEHALNFHNFKDNQVSVVGSARFDNYFTLRNNPNESLFKKKYVLFLGSSLPWNEELALKKIDKHIDNNKEIYLDTFVVYRPHPFRQYKTNFKKDSFKNVVLDPQIEKLKEREWPEINYYPKILSNSLFVVGGLTSMIIESLIFWKKYLAVAYNDDFLRSQDYILKTRPHLFEISKVDNVLLCKNSEDFEKLFFEIYKKYNLVNKKKTDEQRNFFLHQDNLDFTKRIELNLNKILKT